HAPAAERTEGVRLLNPFVRWLARIPAPIQTKLLIALGILAALLTALGVIGLVVLGQANARAERLVELQLRTAASTDLRLATTAQLFLLTRAVALHQPFTCDAALRPVDSTRLRFIWIRSRRRETTFRLP